MRPSGNRPPVNRLHRRSLGIAAAALLTVSLLGNPAIAQPRDSFKIAWSIYVGWEPWGYAQNARASSRSGPTSTRSRSSSRW